MCRPMILKSPTCGHRWFTLMQPCRKNLGFNSCPYIATGRVLPFTSGPTYYAYPGKCPTCDLKGEYDRNVIRLIYVDHHRVKCRRGRLVREYEIHLCNVM
ncbi:hypothetical protein AJ80_08101 [Polytolypa hystricis UAMH7299]|uniref:Uncharacterized protein n=1 Tax=Polytolypa hystricis (strain UAMH7299) TaxID=1447883 RepID=A0A2B7XDU8_POLH7|nr:hypothetical protein AJ80_08101 [Polytolypa hystricis UAMH7299]